MVVGQEDPLHTAKAEHQGTLEQNVPHRSLPMGAPTATGQSLDLGGWSYDHHVGKLRGEQGHCRFMLGLVAKFELCFDLGDD
jgi:hypothetical protein